LNDVAAIIGDDDRQRRIEMRQMIIIAQAGFPLQAASLIQAPGRRMHAGCVNGRP
jgi:hypothetical protein